MQENSFQTPDGLTIHTVYWQAASERQRVVIVVHGIGEHFGRYDHVAKHLNQAGYHVYGLDHRGHGKSEGTRNHVDNDTQFISDLKQYVDAIKTKHSDSKFYILGHSMGSVISLQFMLTYPDIVDALIVTGTATDVASGVPPILRSVANFIYRIYPKAPIQPPGGDNVLTRDPEMLALADNDPLFYKGWTKTSIAKYVVETGEMIQERAHEITLPILIMHGEADNLTPISGSHIMYERVSSTDKTLKTWEGMYHEVMNEIGREEVLQTITDWLDKH